uniref:Uncharacterized protein n=1 Tax=Oryza brachyantha TaxID=4533 RepID=J3M240_ORYBR
NFVNFSALRSEINGLIFSHIIKETGKPYQLPIHRGSAYLGYSLDGVKSCQRATASPTLVICWWPI